MPIQTEQNVFEDMGGVYDTLKERELWPMMAVHTKIVPEDPHWHIQNNHIFIVEGEAEFHDVEADIWHKLSAGDICYIPRRTLHAIRADGPVVFIAAFDEAMRLTEFVPYPPAALS